MRAPAEHGRVERVGGAEHRQRGRGRPQLLDRRREPPTLTCGGMRARPGREIDDLGAAVEPTWRMPGVSARAELAERRGPWREVGGGANRATATATAGAGRRQRCRPSEIASARTASSVAGMRRITCVNPAAPRKLRSPGGFSVTGGGRHAPRGLCGGDSLTSAKDGQGCQAHRAGRRRRLRSDGSTRGRPSGRRSGGGRRARRRSKTALVLGGGGFTGAVYEIGALRALDLLSVSHSINEFDVYVGTSAGAFVGGGGRQRASRRSR